jgi:hypothetical protein
VAAQPAGGERRRVEWRSGDAAVATPPAAPPAPTTVDVRDAEEAAQDGRMVPPPRQVAAEEAAQDGRVAPHRQVAAGDPGPS